MVISGYVLHLPEEESVVLSGPAARRLIDGGNGDEIGRASCRERVYAPV